MEDWQLLNDYRNDGSEAAFVELMDRHLDMVYSTALRRLGDVPAAEEVAQSVFCLLVQKAHQLTADVVLVGWLYQTARYQAANYVRGERRRRQREQDAVNMNSVNTESSAPWKQIAPVLDEAMDQLTDQDRHALLLRFFEDKSLPEVGRTLGVSEDAARMRVNRSLDKLRSLLEAKGVACATAALGAMLVAGAVQAAPCQAAQAIRSATLAAAKIARAPVPPPAAGSSVNPGHWVLKTAFLGGLALMLVFIAGLYLYNQYLAHELRLRAAAPPPPANLAATQVTRSAQPRRSRPPLSASSHPVADSVAPTSDTAPAQIMIEIKQVETPDEFGAALAMNAFRGLGGDAGAASNALTRTPFPITENIPGNDAGIASSAPPVTTSPGEPGSSQLPQPSVTGLVTESQLHAVLKALEARPGVEIVSTPTVTTLSGRQVQIRQDNSPTPRPNPADRLTQPPTDGTPADVEAHLGIDLQSAPASVLMTPPSLPSPAGLMIDILPIVLADGYTIQMTLMLSMVEAVSDVSPRPGHLSEAAVTVPLSPIRQYTTRAVVRDGQTALLGIPVGKLPRAGEETENRKTRLIFITPHLVDPAGNRVHVEDNLPFDPNSIPSQTPE